MDKLIKMKNRLLVATALIFAISLLSACSIAGANLGAIGIHTTSALGAIADRTSSPLLTICHATDDPANPYEELTVNKAELNVHRGHPNDIIPVPANGCPANTVLTSDGKITICHATGSQTNPYDEISVSVNGLNGHDKHEGDIIPAPEEGCPAASGAIGNRFTTFLGAIGNRTTTPLETACHATGDPANPYEEITITYDISPVPANGCPANPVLISDGKITICHATGDQTNPYNEITVSVIGLNGHGAHEGDVFPSSEGGCPTTSSVIGNSNTTTPGAFGNRITTTLVAIGNRITTTLSAIGNRTATAVTVCHATDDPANPYAELTVNKAELNVHRGHPNDIIPVPANGCPASPVLTSDGKITICHATGSQTNPYDMITVSVNGLNGHGKHEGDIIPAPDGSCPTSPVTTSADTITICHANGSQTNPYDMITVSVNGLNGHGKHEGDIIPAPEGGCPASLWTTSNDKITICHATGSQKNPYNEITVSVNGLDGHGKHEGDIIPAPGGGCPTGGPSGKKPNNGKP